MTLHPFQGYASAIDDELPEVVTVLDAYRVVKLGGPVADEEGRREQQDVLGHRGRKGTSLHSIGRNLRRWQAALLAAGGRRPWRRTPAPVRLCKAGPTDFSIKPF